MNRMQKNISPRGIIFCHVKAEYPKMRFSEGLPASEAAWGAGSRGFFSTTGEGAKGDEGLGRPISGLCNKMHSGSILVQHLQLIDPSDEI